MIVCDILVIWPSDYCIDLISGFLFELLRSIRIEVGVILRSVIVIVI